jgi:hypothetical protein
MADSQINYNKKTFLQIREELETFVKEQYPEVITDFSDSNIGSLLLDLNAAVGNILSYNTDRAFQETQVDNAQQRESIINIARTFGFNIPGKRASVTVVDFSVVVPVRGDKPDDRYYPVLAPGAQIVGGGKTFETIDTIDWKSNISAYGNANRTFVPNIDANGIIQSYTVRKREVVFNGKTSVYKQVIRSENVIPFYEILLPDGDVVSVESVILLAGTEFSGTPPDAEFLNIDNRYFEVDYLAQQKVFIEDPNGGSNHSTTGSTSIKAGIWIDITKKFIKEFTSNGNCKLIFGAGNADADAFKTGLIKAGVTNEFFLNNYIENSALGDKLKSDYTLFVKYRTGGGASSNIGANVLKGLGNYNLIVNGPNGSFNTTVQRSLTVNNPIPAFGGNDGLSIDQIRNLTKYNFASQFRDIQIKDYLLQVYKMPGKFGSPFRANAFKEDNKVVIVILGIGEDSKLDNQSTSILRNNISEYLLEFRPFNDYIEIRDGKIFNLAFDFDIYIENQNEALIANTIIRTVADYFDITKRDMNEDIFLAPLFNTINDVPGVININSAKVFNKVGGEYSLNPIEQPYENNDTRQIRIINNTVYSTESSMFEIRYPERDIRLFLRKKADLFR